MADELKTYQELHSLDAAQKTLDLLKQNEIDYEVRLGKVSLKALLAFKKPILTTC